MRKSKCIVFVAFTAMEWALSLLAILPIILMQATGVAALTTNSDIIGIAVAGCASFALLALVIGMLIASCNWRTWFGRWMRQQGKIRMPEDYFKKKNGETKQRLITGSQRVLIPQMNGHPPRPVVDREKFVQGWRQGNPSVSHRIYEEKDAMMELGEEVDDDYKIEAEVVDNEILDVGPFKQDHSKEIPIKGDVYPEPYIYSAVDSTKMPGRSVGNSVKPPSDFRTSAVVSDKSGRNVGNSVKPSDSRTSAIVSDISGRHVGNSVKPTSDSRTSAIIRDISGRNVGNSVKPTSDSRTSAIVSDISGRSVGNSVKPTSDSITSAIVSDISEISVGNSVKPTSDSRTWGVVTKGNGAEYYMAGTNKEKKFDEGLLYM